MTDNMTPQLTLDPTAAAAEAVPTLTLTPEAPEAPQVCLLYTSPSPRD